MMKMKCATGKSHGKIILMGEHAVVYGEPSIALPFPAVDMVATICEKEGPLTVDCSYYNGIASAMPEVLESLHTAILTTLAALEKTSDNISITIESSIPAERGMGSSAAVSVALTRALFCYFDAELTDERLLSLVNVAEKVAHGNPSGLDAAMTSGEDPLYFIKGKPFKKFPLNITACLIVGDTGITGQTREAVTSIAQKLKGEQKDVYLHAIKTLGRLTARAKTAIEKNDPASLGKLMNGAHNELSLLEVSSKELDKLVTAALSANALGAKLTGGGRGGCMIALTATPAEAQRVEHALHQAGAVRTWIYQMGGNQDAK